MQWEECIGTSRHSITDDDPERRWVQGESDAAKVNASLQGTGEKKHHRTLRDSVFRLLTEEYATKYVPFASTKYQPKNTEEEKASANDVKFFLNLEQVHNNIHVSVFIWHER